MLSAESLPATRGPTPERKSRFPTFRACGYAPTGFGALDEEIVEELLIFYKCVSFFYEGNLRGDCVNLNPKNKLRNTNFH